MLILTKRSSLLRTTLKNKLKVSKYTIIILDFEEQILINEHIN